MIVGVWSGSILRHRKQRRQQSSAERQRNHRKERQRLPPSPAGAAAHTRLKRDDRFREFSPAGVAMTDERRHAAPPERTHDMLRWWCRLTVRCSPASHDSAILLRPLLGCRRAVDTWRHESINERPFEEQNCSLDSKRSGVVSSHMSACPASTNSSTKRVTGSITLQHGRRQNGPMGDIEMRGVSFMRADVAPRVVARLGSRLGSRGTKETLNPVYLHLCFRLFIRVCTDTNLQSMSFERTRALRKWTERVHESRRFGGSKIGEAGKERTRTLRKWTWPIRSAAPKFCQRCRTTREHPAEWLCGMLLKKVTPPGSRTQNAPRDPQRSARNATE